ncbi:hypothetical protein ASD8599_03659 [Ascidiaceihabitans donghaensis]|uniref:Uncharacterized protein n=1 Tax=Ascidiaceihabitans donghaensis TaxID=1510460 RepID=A0A2R8BIQ5_9RHOB|nr:hypothetical protein ASD8599_03659 [Ascidiaceihabitans donghaensis]
MNCVSFLAISAVVLLVEYSVFFFVGKFIGQFLIPFGVIKTVVALAISYGVFMASLSLVIPLVMLQGGPESKHFCIEWVDTTVTTLIMLGSVFYLIIIVYSIWRKVTLI